MTVRIDPTVLRQIEGYALEQFPEEACGLLVGRRDANDVVISAARVSKNLAADPCAGFEVDTGLRIRLQRELRGSDAAVVGVFHSHPSGDPEPSATDRTSIWEPDLIWLITAVSAGAVGESRVFAVDSGNTAAAFRRMAMVDA